jgi:lysophospholipase L1-like esterase
MYRFDTRKLLGLIVVFVVLCSGFWVAFKIDAAFGIGESVKIMPLGNSLTIGYPGSEGYRKKLYVDLTNAGYDVDFVGSQSNGADFDTDHEGYGGKEAWWLNDILYGLLDSPNHPDIILYHIGTNSLYDGGIGATQAALDANESLGIIYGFDPTITVILAKIINTTDTDQNDRTYAYNLLLEQHAQFWSADGKSIIFVNMTDALNYTTDMEDDGLHPNADGYGKMADVWYAALVNLLDYPIITSTPVTQAIAGQLYTYDVDATGVPAPTYALTASPSGMTIDPTSGLIEWTPGVEQVGPNAVEVNASNSEGSDAQSFTVTVRVQPEGMIGYWKMDDTSIPPIVDSYDGRDGTNVTGAPVPSAGIVNGALYFDGSAEVDVPDNGDGFDWTSTDSFTIELWMNTNASLPNNVMVGRDDWPVHWWVGAYGNAANFILQSRIDPYVYVTGTTPINDGDWHHVVAVRDESGNKIRIYVDGLEEKSADASYTGDFSSTVNLTIGYLNREESHYRYTGLLDEIAIYNGAFTLAEIQQHYNNGLAGKGYIPSVSVSPAGPVSLVVGGSQLFAANASGGTGSYGYAWYLDGTVVPGAGDSTWTFEPLIAGPYLVYANVTDSAGVWAASNTVSITVADALSVSVSPASVSLIVDQSQLFTATASGGKPPYSYDWFLNGTLVPDAVDSTWTFLPVSAGFYLVYANVTDDVNVTAQSNTVSATVSAPLFAFDFGTETSPVEPGYDKVTNDTLYPEGSGYGWSDISGLVSIDRGAPNNLTRDFVTSLTEHTFNVDLDDGVYQVTVIIGDQNLMHDKIDVYAENIRVIDDLTVAIGEFHEQSFLATVADGQLNIRILSDGGTALTWIINAITIIATLSVSVSPVGPVSLTVGGSQLFTATVSGGTLPYSYEWYLNGSLVQSGLNSTWNFTGGSVGAFEVYVNVTDNVNATAQSNTVSITVIVVQVSLTVGVSGSGVTNVTGTTPYDLFSNVTVLATPDSGWLFDYWLLNDTGVGSENPYTVNMTANFNLTAVFVRVEYGLLVEVSGSGSTNATGTTLYPSGSVVAVNATPASGWVLNNWFLNGSDAGATNPYVLTMDQNYNLTVVFVEVEFGLLVEVSGSGVTNVTGTTFYASGSNVPVLATADSGWVFGKWLLNGTDQGSVDPIVVLMDRNRNLTAVFVEQYGLLVQVTGSGSTNVTGTTFYPSGTNVPVNATPAAGWTFGNWLLNGTDQGSANPIVVTMSENRNLTAVFVQIQYGLLVGVSGSGVTNVTGTTFYLSGSSVPVEATPSAGWVLGQWLLNGTDAGSDNPIVVLMTENRNLTAVFVPENEVVLAGWLVDESLTNASYTLSYSSLHLELEAVDTSSRVTIYSLNVPSVSLSDYYYIDVSVTGSANARVLLRFFLDDGGGFDVVYWGDVAALDASMFDLSPYAGRTMSVVYVALMSSDGLTASIDIAKIELVAEAPSPEVPLAGWAVDPSLTNAPYTLSSTASLLSLDLDASDTGSRVTIYTFGVPVLDLGGYDHIDVSVTGSVNARVLLRFFLDDGSGFDVVYWGDAATLDAISFDLSAYAGRTLAVGYVALMSSDGLTAGIDITQIALVATAPPPEVPLAGWTVDESLTNAPYTLDSTPSLLSLDLAASDTSSRVTIYTLAVPTSDLGGFDHIDVSVTGTGNARILLRFFLDDGSGFDVVYWGDAATLDAISFDLSAYAGRTLAVGYVALMSSDGLTAGIDITQIALVATAPPPEVPLAGWTVDESLTNAPYTLDSSPSLLSLDLDASDTSSRVTIYTVAVPTSDLGDFDHIDVAVTGTGNARILMRFFMDDGSGFDVVYWADPATLNDIEFDLGPYAGRTLTIAYIALMSSDGQDAGIDITEIALVA